MAKKTTTTTDAVYTPDLPEQVAAPAASAGASEPAPAKVASAWVVLEDRTVAISGCITKVRAGKLVRDRVIAEALIKQGVKMEARCE